MEISKSIISVIKKLIFNKPQYRRVIYGIRKLILFHNLEPMHIA